MSNIRLRHVVAALILVLIVATASFVALSLTSLEWPFASASPFSPNPFGGPKPAQGFLLINASHLSDGIQQPVSGATVSLLAKTDNSLLNPNVTDANGMIGYTLPQGGYFINVASKYGSASNSVSVFGGYTTVANYVSINQSELALSFDILTQQPNIVAPWDTVYVQLPNVLYGLNLSAVNTFIEPGYLGSSNSSGPARSFGIFRFPTSTVQIPAKIISEEILTSGTSFWLQLKPDAVFSTSGLSVLKIMEYNSTITVSIKNNSVLVK